MAVLTNIPNNTSARDWRDTVNSLIKRIAALEAAGVPVETPAPAFTTQPSVSPTSGTAGSTVYAATPGIVSNGSVVSRAWLLNGTAISTGVTAVPASAGTLTYQETASGPGGTTTSTVQVAAVTAATVTPTPAPSFISQPGISPSTGTAGATTFTATAGNVSNGSITARSWTINGTVISTGIAASPASSGTLTYQETATGPGGTTQSTVQQVTVATAALPAPAFTSQPTVSPSTGTAGTTTYTATPGAVSNGTITSRAWALNGSTISTGLSAAPAAAGTLTYQEFATGTGGSASSSVLTRTVSAATPTLTLSPTSISIASNAAAGTTVSSISNVPSGVTPSVTPNDGRLVIAGSASAGWKVVLGMSALSAGQVNFTVAANGATSAGGVLTVTAPIVGQTPDGPLEAAMSPANTTLRSTYAMSTPELAIPIPSQMIKSDGTVDGGGVYYGGGGGVKMPCATYPDRRFWYYSKDHGPGTSATNGIYLSVTVGDPTVGSNFKVYEDAVAAGWLYDIPNLPASNPIWPGATGSTQPETPYAMWVADDDGKNGMVVMAYQTGGGAKSRYDGSNYRDQATVRATAVDGIHFTGDLVAWCENRTIDQGYSHTGYVHFAKSIFLDFPYKYICYGLGGIYGCNDPRTEVWQNVTGYQTNAGRYLAGLPSSWTPQRNRWLPASAKRTSQGVSMLVSIGSPQSGAGTAASGIYEALLGEDGIQVLGKPQLVIAMGAQGSGYESEVNVQCYGVFGDKEFILFDGAGKPPADAEYKKRGYVASSPRRNPANTVFAPQVPPTPATMRKRDLSLRGTSLPNTLSLYVIGAPVITYDAEFGLTVSLKAGDKVVVVEKDGFDPNTTEMADVLARDWSALSDVTASADALRVPWVGFTAEPGNLADMLNVRAITLDPANSYASVAHVRDNGVSTNTAYVLSEELGYGAASIPGKQRKDTGLRWFPQDSGNGCFQLSNGNTETSYMTNQMSMGTATRGKRWYRFLAFEGTGVTKVGVRGLLTREYDTNPTPQTGKTLTLSNPKPDVGAPWTSFILGHTVGSGITATSSDGTPLSIGVTDNTGKRTISGTFTNAGAPTITIKETPIGSTLKQSTAGVTVAAPPVGVTVVGTPTVFANSTNNITYTTSSMDIGTATEDRYVVAMFELVATDATEFGALSAAITPAGGSAIPMTLVKQVQTNTDTPWTTGGPNVIAAFVAKVPSSVTTATAATATVTRSGGGVASRMGGCIIAARNLNPALVDFATNGAPRGTNANSPMPVVIDKPAKGLVVATAYFSTSGTTFTGAAFEVPTATGNDAAVASNNNQATQTWTGLANVMAPANAQIENSGSGGGTLLAVSFAPAS